MKRLQFALITLALLIAAAVSGRVEHAATPDDKPKVEDIVAKHLQSIAKDEARAAVKSRVIAGATVATRKSATTEIRWVLTRSIPASTPA
jgi:hypothetical protein